MKKTILVSIFLVAQFFIFTSCSNDDTAEPELTLEEIKQDIEATFDGLVNCLNGYESGEFSSALQNFFMINNGDLEEDYSDFLVNQLEVFDFDLENFEMTNYSGIYNWNNSNDQWDFTSNSQNKLVFNFPFLESGTENNMTITIDKYENQSFVIDFETQYYPTSLIGTIERDGNEIYSLDMDNVTYQSNTENITPTNFDIEIMTEPMTHFFTLDESSANKFAFNYTSNNNGECETNFTINATTLTSNYASIEEIEDFSEASGTIGHGDLEVVHTVDLSSLNAIEEPTINEINEYVTADVFLGNSQIGTLEYRENNDESQVFIIYNDGTSENVNTYVNEELGNEIELIFSNFTN